MASIESHAGDSILVPAVGGLIALVFNGFIAGTPGANRFGPAAAGQSRAGQSRAGQATAGA